MTAKECITGRRSIRSYSNRPVERDTINTVIETASYAPSWKNTQITRYVAVSDPQLKAAIADKACTAWVGNKNIIDSAPVLMVITYVKGRSGYERDGSFTTAKGDRWESFDAGIATEAFCLSAYEQGLGTVIMGIFDDAVVAELLELPEDRGVAALVALGYPAEEPVAPKRKSVEELIVYK